ncbi:Slc47a1 [Symbiodinium microadriaticum]|nr:Slc47a1 [Symbiodinium microadriaticum]
MQVGFARAFCDIHCVRDAVIRGDRSIIRNLEMATKKTNNNLKALVKWSVDASHTDIGWIGEKLDYMHIINTAYMQEIHDAWVNVGSFPFVRPRLASPGAARPEAVTASDLSTFTEA